MPSVADLLPNLEVKELWKSVPNCRSYRPECSDCLSNWWLTVVLFLRAILYSHFAVHWTTFRRYFADRRKELFEMRRTVVLCQENYEPAWNTYWTYTICAPRPNLRFISVIGDVRHIMLPLLSAFERTLNRIASSPTPSSLSSKHK